MCVCVCVCDEGRVVGDAEESRAFLYLLPYAPGSPPSGVTLSNYSKPDLSRPAAWASFR